MKQGLKTTGMVGVVSLGTVFGAAGCATTKHVAFGNSQEQRDEARFFNNERHGWHEHHWWTGEAADGHTHFRNNGSTRTAKNYRHANHMVGPHIPGVYWNDVDDFYDYYYPNGDQPQPNP